MGLDERGTQAHRDSSESQGSRDPGQSESPDLASSGNSRPGPALCLAESYRRRQTALFTDICQASPQSGSWVSTGRRGPVWGDGATSEGQTLFIHHSAGCWLPWAHVSVRTGGGGPPSPPSSHPPFLPSIFSSNRRSGAFSVPDLCYATGF